MIKTNEMPALFVSGSEVNTGSILHFQYNGLSRVVRVDRVESTYVQGENLPHDGREPSNKFATYRFDRIDGKIEMLLDLILD